MTKKWIIASLILVALLTTISCQTGMEDESHSDVVDSSSPDETEAASTTPDATSQTGSTDATETPKEVVTIQPTELIQPTDLVYQGAFRLPDEYIEIWGDQVNFWSYSGNAMTYYPGGDPSGANDGFPGSLFMVGHDQSQFVSEISIPLPVNSKNLGDLNMATTLQEPADITSDMFEYLELPTAGLAYLPAQGQQATDKLYFCWGQHFQGDESSHGWAELNLASPQPAGPWHFGGYTNYVSNDYLFEIPKSWSDVYAPEMRLASGRFREGVWGGFGPALFAYSPWSDGNPPAPNTTLTTITPLLLYGVQESGLIDIVTSDSMRMDTYKEPDLWTGGAWLTVGERSAVIFIGTKALGNYWYGFANGVIWEYDCAEQDPPTCPDVPDWPYSDRGYWADDIESQIIFYNPADLTAVYYGQMETWEPQPYASISIDDYLFDTGYDYERAKRQLLGACAFDRDNGILYITERMVMEDEEKSVIHVWKIER